MSIFTRSPEKSTTIKKAPRGQSFIEAMVAITVLVTAVSSALALVQSSITATRVGGAQIVAANLAREGLEVVRSLRDTNWLQSQSFQVGLVDGGGAKAARPLLNLESGVWSLSFASTALTSANAAVYLTTSGVFTQADAQPTGSTVTPYARVLTIDHLCRDTSTGVERVVGGAATCLVSEQLSGLAVTSSVRYRSLGGSYRTLTIEERLYDWR
jgi:Tfp pilus assembly protein PilV